MDEKRECELIQPAQAGSMKKAYWDASFGLQQVDDLEPSAYMYQLARRNIEGELELPEVEELLHAYYENEAADERSSRTKECDFVSARINALLQSKIFTFSPVTLKMIHGQLLRGIYGHAGQFKRQNYRKDGPVLGGRTVVYGSANMVEELLRYDFEQEKKQKYTELRQEETVKRIAEFTSSIWQVHPFAEGNTRTTAVFMTKYLASIGLLFDIGQFRSNSKYFRNALVRSNFSDYVNGIETNNEYLERFFWNALYQKEYPLRNQDLIIE